MKIILSRKGFDSGYGGCASPIFPDGSMASFPIPDALAAHTMGEIVCGGYNLGEIARDLTQNLKPENPLGVNQSIHLDPFLCCTQPNPPPDWLPAFGQDGAAQTHLANQKVGKGDIFLFFGWFRQVEWVDTGGQKRWRFVRGAPNLHVIFGWLQVGQVIAVGSNPVPGAYLALADHPHIQDANRFLVHNTIYVASPELVVDNRPLGLPGGGIFNRFAKKLRLTHPKSHAKSVWQLPRWFSRSDVTGKPTLTFNTNDHKWVHETKYPTKVKLNSVARGQEFVLDSTEYKKSPDWLKQLFEPRPGHELKKPASDLSQHIHLPEGTASAVKMTPRFSRVNYAELKARQQENFNFQKVSAMLADYGYMTLRVSSDWQSADFIAQHIDGVTFLKVQLKGRFTIDKKYLHKDLHICFPDRGIWYLCPHDMLVAETLRVTNVENTVAWTPENGNYHAAKAPEEITPFLKEFAVGKVERYAL